MKTWKELTFNLIVAILAVLAICVIGCEIPNGGYHNQIPAEADFNINGTGTFTYDGNPKTVTVTAKEGKTSGTITVKYSGTTTAPTAVGTYTVTFDVAAASGWNAVSELYAGMLTINAAVFDNKTPKEDDFIISGTGTFTYDGSPKTVTVTAKEGKTGGEIIVKYNGNTAAPSVVGIYNVTFDVAAADDWKAVTGLSAGTLTIITSTSDNKTPVAADYDISGTIVTYDGSAKTVTVTAKPGKSPGAVTIKYGGSAAAPSVVGTYNVTFDVAAAGDWKAATGLSAGTLTIGNATPIAGDYNIGNLTQMEGSVSAVTISPKTGKSTGGVTIYYNGSTTIPSAAGTYAVTFNVAAVTNWNPATNLSAGNLIIGSSNNQTPVAGDYDISGTTVTYDGSSKAVTVKAKSGKSSGAVTVEYNNSTTAPLGAGTYTVTFNVAAAAGWNAASGLSAGTLTINAATPVAGDYDIGNLMQMAGSVTAVTITPKTGKSNGTVTIYYNNSTTLPTTAGTYAVTFNVAAVTNWNAASGLSAGNLVISGPNNQTPTAADYNIGNLQQTFGSVSAVTVTPKTGKSSGAVTIYYNGSTTLPTTTGSYSVTFDVAAASGWNAASGLSAGIFYIYRLDPVASDYIISNLTQTVGNVSAVIITPKEGKSTGAVRIFYDGSIILPTEVGTYPVTFYVAEVTGWNDAYFDAGILTINASDGFSISQTGNYQFASLNYGYNNAPAALTITVTNKGNQPTGILTAALSGTNSNSFTLSKTSISSIAINGTDTFTVRPNTGLNTGKYTAIVTVSGGANVASKAFGVSFSVVNPDIYMITGSGTSFTATKGVSIIETADQPIQTVINAIRTHAASNARTIQFGDGAAVLDIGNASAGFNNTGGTWGAITLTGKITSSNSNDTAGTIVIDNAVSVTSTADIANINGKAVWNNSTGMVTISGGTISGVINNSTGTVTISGGTISGVINNSTGTVTISGGTVSATNDAAVRNASTSNITVSGTAKVTSANTSYDRGTIYLVDSINILRVSLEITGGTVENTSITTGCAIYCDIRPNATAVSISGGTVTKSGTATSGYAVYSTNTGSVSITSGATIIGQRYRC